KAPGRKAPARKAPARKKPAARAQPARKAPARTAPTRKTPRRKAQPRGRARAISERAFAGGQLIPIAAGRPAVAVRQLPDSGVVVRMTRGRAWIGVLGLLLVGIVALNVATLSFAASAGDIDAEIVALEKENGVLDGRLATIEGTERVRGEAAALGLGMPSSDEIHFSQVSADDVAVAAQRLAGAGG
ncbi:MAG TPA: hypothetical protein VK889_06725, partial [Solirubrobacterales bacterium]|nr:hypothetical protein [Solirubrobacterales bacterium]